jgi:hypothetical protein
MKRERKPPFDPNWQRPSYCARIPLKGPAALGGAAAPVAAPRPHDRIGRAFVEVGLARWRPLFCLHDAGCCTHLVTRPLLGNQLARKISLVWRGGTGRRNEFQVFAKSSESAVKQSQPEPFSVQ